MKNIEESLSFLPIRNAAEFGTLIRRYRKNHHITLESVSGISQLSMRFLSELERGKETAELGKALKALQLLGLELIIQPRGYHDAAQHRENNVS
jgi:HTH-type transcriptional regulator / antitoxin HipB